MKMYSYSYLYSGFSNVLVVVLMKMYLSPCMLVSIYVWPPLGRGILGTGILISNKILVSNLFVNINILISFTFMKG